MRTLQMTTASLALIAATPALAQNAPTPAAEAALSQSDVIVTARRREENIRVVPGTISAVTAEQLDAKGPIAGTGDLLSTVPGVRFNDVAAENLSEVSIRGSGTQRATGADSGVGLFVNGAYVGSSTLGGRNFKTLDYFDLERVEVLEGPQGALYGRNSEYGVINIVLAKPKFETSGYVRNQYTFGLDQDRLAGVVNQKLSDTLALRVGGEVYGQSKGFYYDPNHDRYYDSTRGWNARGQLRYRSGPLDVNLLVDAQDLKLPTFVNSYVVPGGGVNAQIPLGYTQSRFVLPHEGTDATRQKEVRTILNASLELGDDITLQSTTMASKWRSTQQYGAALDLATVTAMRQLGEIGVYPFAQVRTDVKDRTLYQDLHLTGKADGGRLTWIVGGEGLYQRDDYQLTIGSSPCALTATSSFCTGTPTQHVCVKPLPTSANCPVNYPLAFGTDSRTRQRVYSLSAYASLQYTIGDLTLAGEGRFSHDHKAATQGITALYTTTYTKLPTTFAFSSNEPVYTVTASYKLPGGSGTLLYAKVGSGYRAGGVNNGSYNAAAPNPFVFTYGNENTTSYEAGVKSSLTHTLFLRLSAYLSRTGDAITSINDGCTATNICGTGQQIFNVNGGTIHARGLEASLDGRFRAAGGMLSVNLNGATQTAHFAKVPTGVSGLPVQGSDVAQIPDWTMSAVVDYRHPITDNIAAFVNLSYSGQRGGSQDTVTLATPSIALSDFDVFGARAGLDFGRIQAAAFIRNFTDEAIQVLKFTQANYPLSVRWNKPRTAGVSLAYRW